MAKPIRPVAPPLALRSNPATFSANAESNITYQFDALPNWMDALGDFVDDRADDALAAALAGDLPPITGKAGQFLRVKSDETGAEFLGGANLSALAGVSTTGLLARTGAGTAATVDIVGTVAQSGGVPTGAIIERGSNANGRFTKFADGTMVQSIIYNNNRTSSGPRTVNLTFPAPFVDLDYVAATGCQSARPDLQGDPAMHAKGLTGASFTDERSNDTPSTNSVLLLGRWF